MDRQRERDTGEKRTLLNFAGGDPDVGSEWVVRDCSSVSVRPSIETKDG